MTDSSIKITEKNWIKVGQAIDVEQARSKQRTLTWLTVQEELHQAEQALRAMSIPQKYWEGCKVHVQEHFKLPNAYKYLAESTCVSIVRGANAWYFVRAYRAAGNSGRSSLTLSETAIANIPRTMAL
jgi:hypothetical protein